MKHHCVATILIAAIYTVAGAQPPELARAMSEMETARGQWEALRYSEHYDALSAAVVGFMEAHPAAAPLHLSAIGYLQEAVSEAPRDTRPGLLQGAFALLPEASALPSPEHLQRRQEIIWEQTRLAEGSAALAESIEQEIASSGEDIDFALTAYDFLQRSLKAHEEPDAVRVLLGPAYDALPQDTTGFTGEQQARYEALVAEGVSILDGDGVAGDFALDTSYENSLVPGEAADRIPAYLLGEERFGELETWLDDFWDANADNPAVLVAMSDRVAMGYQVQGLYDAAFSTLDRYRRAFPEEFQNANPSYATNYLSHAVASLEHGGSTSAARAVLDEVLAFGLVAVEQLPEDRREMLEGMYGLIGGLYKHLGDPENALTYYKMALDAVLNGSKRDHLIRSHERNVARLEGRPIDVGVPENRKAERVAAADPEEAVETDATAGGDTDSTLSVVAASDGEDVPPAAAGEPTPQEAGFPLLGSLAGLAAAAALAAIVTAVLVRRSGKKNALGRA